jgi:anthranilate/para-aminobenzoate synthase component II
MRYHSLAVRLEGNPQLDLIAVSEEDQVAMACAHKSLPLTGIQFHPESIGTPGGKRMLDNWAHNFSAHK